MRRAACEEGSLGGIQRDRDGRGGRSTITVGHDRSLYDHRPRIRTRQHKEHLDYFDQGGGGGRHTYTWYKAIDVDLVRTPSTRYTRYTILKEKNKQPPCLTG